MGKVLMYTYYNRYKSLFNILLFLSSASPCLIFALEILNNNRDDNLLLPVLYNIVLLTAGMYLIFKKELISKVLSGLKIADTIFTGLSTVLISLFIFLSIYNDLGCIPVYMGSTLFTALPALFFILAYIGILVSAYTGEGRQTVKALVVLVIIIILQFTIHLGTGLDAFNVTVMCFSYDFGFISRGLIGSLIRLIALITGKSVTLELIYIFSVVGLVFWVGLITALSMLIVKKTETTEAKRSVFLLTLAFALGFGFSTYIRDLGRLDIYLMALTAIACMLIIKNKAQFLILPIIMTAVLVHQGYLLLYFNLVLTLLFYRSSKLKENRKKYILIILLAVILCSALFIYLYFFGKAKEGMTLKQIEDCVAGITGRTYVRTDIIRQELFKEAVSYRGGSLSELLLAFLLFSPWFAFVINIWRKVISVAEKKTKLLYYLLPLGVLTLLPLYILEVDRGRWTYALFFYELMLPLMLIGMGDSIIKAVLCKTVAKLTKRPGISVLIYTYVFVLGPFHVIEINGLSAWLISFFS